MAACGPLPTVGHTTAKTVMLANDPTGQLAREGVAEFHPQVECQRLVRLARTHRRGGNRGRWRGWRLLPVRE